MKTIFLFIFLFSYSGILTCKCQDPTFGSISDAAAYYHPSFTSLQKGFELNMNYRNHWPAVQSLFETEYCGLNGQFVLPDLKNWSFGLGYSILKDEESVGNMVTMNHKFIMRSKWMLDYDPSNTGKGCVKKEKSLTLAFYVGLNTKRYDYSALVFSDQLLMNGQITPSNVGLGDYGTNSSDGDLGASVTWFDNKGFIEDYFLMISLSAHHIENYDEASFINSRERLPAYLICTVNFGNQINEKAEKKNRLSYRLTGQWEKQASVYRLSFGGLGGAVLQKWKINQPGIFCGIQMNYANQIFDGLGINTNAFTIGPILKYHVKNTVIKCGFTFDLVTTGLNQFNTGASKEAFLNLKLFNECEGNPVCPSF